VIQIQHILLVVALVVVVVVLVETAVPALKLAMAALGVQVVLAAWALRAAQVVPVVLAPVAQAARSNYVLQYSMLLALL